MVQKKLNVGKMKLIAQKGEPHVAKPSERLFAFFDLSTFSGEPWVTPEDSINRI